MKILFILLWVCLNAGAASLSGVVTDVHDGDTLKMKSGGSYYKVRLAYIDAPELSQLYGHASRISLEQLTLNKEVAATCPSKDRYGRLLCTLAIGSEDINAIQVKRGMAWAYLRYAPKGTTLKGVQAEAMERKRGLWGGLNPQAPWDYRRGARD